jgi:mannose-1-phosphate guanylyltransferase/mannose-6-phosphate isomerase
MDKNEINNFVINKSDSILNALLKIENNNKGFLIVLDENGKVVSTLTDGDIRRQLISGKLISDTIKIERHFKVLKDDDDFNIVCTLFRSKKIKFLPIVNQSNHLVNVVTKEQFQSLLLRGQKWDPKNVPDNFDDNESSYDIYNRPWGFYKSTFLCDFVQSKLIAVFPNERLSLQEHKRREEHWIVVKGCGKVILGDSTLDIYPGKYVYVPKGCKHQIINDSEENIILTEVQLGDYFGEDDILRYSDKYGRE